MRLGHLCLFALLLAPAFAAGQKDDRIKDRPRADRVVKDKEADVKKDEETKASLSSEEHTLKQAHLPTTGAALVDFFRKRTPGGADPEKVPGLIKQLGDKAAD